MSRPFMVLSGDAIHKFHPDELQRQMMLALADGIETIHIVPTDKEVQPLVDKLNKTEFNNIKLDYKLKVIRGDTEYIANGAEFFLDEHGVQWVKFFPKNGYNQRQEHMLRTEEVTVVRRGKEGRA